MTLMRYTRPRHDVMNKRFSDIMDEFFNDAVASNNGSFVPGIDVSETNDQFLISAELPGIKKEDINIDLENNHITISGERSFEKEKEDKTFHLVETKYGSFSRSFQLPDNIKEDSIEASYENGLLNITIDKSEDEVKKKIQIK